LLDQIDRVILSLLGKNARMSSLEITRFLKDMGYDITDRGVRHKLQRLERRKVVLGYSAILNPEFIAEKLNRTVFLKFKFSKNYQNLTERLRNYADEEDFCVFSARLSGDFDWIFHFVFDSPEQYDLESNNFLHRFADLITDFRSYEARWVKVSPYSLFAEQELTQRKKRVYEILERLKKYDNLKAKLQMVVESLVKYFDALFARIWLLDMEGRNLILKFSAGKYKNLDGEFSKVPVTLPLFQLHSEKKDSEPKKGERKGTLIIRDVARLRKPQISNDVINDSRVKHPEWAKKEKIKSFAGYPLVYDGKPIGVLAMFSQKKLSPADFELLEIFADHISKELGRYLDTIGELFAN
jgi:DNA-binding Lrp family transcriptional regulator